MITITYIDYIASFFGCVYAGVTAVPAYPPRLNLSATRIQSMVADSRAAFALTTSTILHNIEQRFARTFERAGFRGTSFCPCFGMAESMLIVSSGDGHAALRTLTIDCPG